MTKDFDKLKLPPDLVEALKRKLAQPPHRQEFFRQIGREEQELATKMRDAKRRLQAAAVLPKRQRQTKQFVVLCACLRTLFQPDGRVPDHIGKRELHRMITPQLWRGTWRRLIKTKPPEVPGRDTVDAVRRALNPPVAD